MADNPVRISRKDLVDFLVAEHGLTQQGAKDHIAQVLDGICTLLLQNANNPAGTTLNLPKFGTFILKRTPGRATKNPSTGQEMEIGPRNRISFKPSPEFKEVIRGDFSSSYKS